VGELRGRIAWISGAAGGIGRAIAQRFAEEGACLVLTDIDGDALGEVARAIGPGAVGRTCDVSDPAQVEASFDLCIERFGGLDIVVSNAGIARPAPIEELELAEWEQSFAINSTAHFLVARAALRILRRQGMGGSIVFNASKNVLSPGKGFAAYSASKAAESQLAKVLALEGADLGVRVNLLHPDAVFQGTRLWSDELRAQRARAHGISVEEIEEFYAQRNLLKVAVRPEDVAEAALFFASDRSSRTTGACLTIDGGLPGAFPR
jgi:NAD(P)-dependent dehydrogenase (short-subunit alcohol dehydrogenase family)